jgi:hypothetical protein
MTFYEETVTSIRPYHFNCNKKDQTNIFFKRANLFTKMSDCLRLDGEMYG